MRRLFVLLLLVSILPSCSETSNAPFTLEVGPTFVNGLIPGAMTPLIVTVTDADENSGGEVSISAIAAGATIEVVPEAILSGEVAEVRVVAGAVTGETAIKIEVTATRGSVSQRVVRDVLVFAWEDDRGPYARELLDVFTAWLAAERPGLGIGPETEFHGSMVAPGLLVVSHYAFFSDAWEIGLSWHVMLAPDDWSEAYLRRRTSSSPTLAFRLSSQAAVWQSGVAEISEVTPPPEVTR